METPAVEPASVDPRARIADYAGPAVLLVAAAALLTVVILHAWVCDDAYITFRVVANLLDGYGLRWNVDERVEVYTHPLWLLLHAPLLALTGNIFLSTLGLSLVCTMAAVGVAAAAHPGRPLVTGLVLVVPLACSQAFVEYATSGLENPLSFLLFALFGFWLVRRSEVAPGLGLGLIVGLGLWNRPDTLFLFGPPLAWLLWVERRRVRWGRLLLGLSPVVLWQVFRMLYYGFLFPNTKYAKLDTGLETSWYVERGLAYAADLARGDPPSLMIGVAGLAAALMGWRSWRDPSSAAARRGAVALGILAYAAYVVRVGGDFMAGRFWALPVFAAAWCLHGAVVNTRGMLPVVLVPLLVAGSLTLKPSPGAMQRIRLETRIGDERGFYSATNTLFIPDGEIRTHVLDAPWALHGLELRAGRRDANTLIHGAVGMLGYYAGPSIRIVDSNGLGDPLLARLPVPRRRNPRIGHMTRRVPQGYLYARETGSTERMNPKLAAYYTKLRRVTAGSLLDPERLRLIWGFQWGEYDLLKPRARRDTTVPPPSRTSRSGQRGPAPT